MAREPDKYLNLATQQVTMSGANTETFADITTGISLGQGRGMLIDQIEYFPDQASLELLIATGDRILFGWTASDAVGSLAERSRTTIHLASLGVQPPIGTPASSGGPISLPLAYYFDPPLIIAAPRMFLACGSTSLSAAAGLSSRLYFRYIELTPQEYLELAETFVLVA